ncbi:MAG: esterase/lipase family protein, partial [Gammaproteobacteria bacterium]
LGVEVGVAVRKIEDRMHPAAIILVGHSRGGLAARAYLQRITERPPFKIGLLTIGTPHQGTPLGRISHWLIDRGYEPNDVLADNFFPPDESEKIYMITSVLFSPSVQYQATDHDDSGNPTPPGSPISAQIRRLNARVDRLDDWVSTFGQIYSFNLRLGQNLFSDPLVPGDRADVDILDNGSFYGRALIPGSFSKMRRFVLKNILSGIKKTGASFCLSADRNINNWACDGDGVAPTISQRLTRVPGFSRGRKPLRSASLRGISHIEETKQVMAITRMLDAMSNDLR